MIVKVNTVCSVRVMELFREKKKEKKKRVIGAENKVLVLHRILVSGVVGCVKEWMCICNVSSCTVHIHTHTHINPPTPSSPPL